ncbi:hypothetical protein LR48_Vigan02g128300 [Vigna angularis]|uniref:Uncharacterized protein n=1 Tax=Phaseolus angularis TaxID=3914 RepID=A0A0L9TX16_PHAAN|nr:hypothetical protein LR48_Vigan02g128300 [Vigna angularis]
MDLEDEDTHLFHRLLKTKRTFLPSRKRKGAYPDYRRIKEAPPTNDHCTHRRIALPNDHCTYRRTAVSPYHEHPHYHTTNQNQNGEEVEMDMEKERK